MAFYDVRELDKPGDVWLYNNESFFAFWEWLYNDANVNRLGLTQERICLPYRYAPSLEQCYFTIKEAWGND